jgi:hypothetical protein
MECITEQRIQDYIEGDLASLETTMIRDHLLVCPTCNVLSKAHMKISKRLQQPPLLNPPDCIIQTVLKALYPEFPIYSSIAALIAASFVFLVTWIYIYFDFSNSSLIQALQMTSQHTSGWITDLIRVISTMFSMVYASFKAISSFLNYLLRINLAPNIVGGLFLTLSMIFLYSLFRLFPRKFREKGK